MLKELKTTKKGPSITRQIPNLPILNHFLGWEVFDLRSMAIEISIS
jgi:hypothetical protein